MARGKTLAIVLVALIVGFGAGFALRPVIAPTSSTALPIDSVPGNSIPTSARGIQYFAAHLNEARRVVAECKDGSTRGDECANAQRAVTEAEGQDRFKKFMGH